VRVQIMNLLITQCSPSFLLPLLNSDNPHKILSSSSFINNIFPRSSDWQG